MCTAGEGASLRGKAAAGAQGGEGTVAQGIHTFMNNPTAAGMHTAAAVTWRPGNGRGGELGSSGACGPRESSMGASSWAEVSFGGLAQT